MRLILSFILIVAIWSTTPLAITWSPRDVGLINLLAPVFALWLGAKVNSEQLGIAQWTGAALVLGSLALYQWGAMLFGATLIAKHRSRRQR